MKVFKEEMQAFKDEMSDFKDEMKVYVARIDADIEDARVDRKEMNKQWGALANKMGTLVEDIVAPAVRPAIRKFFGKQEVIGLYQRAEKYSKKTGLRGEFDLLAVSEEAVYLIEAKSTPKKEYLQQFVDEQIPRFRQLFPEYESLPLIPIFASLTIPESLFPTAKALGVYLMAYREWEYMDILNFEEVKVNPKL